jgi:hypothetical protein
MKTLADRSSFSERQPCAGLRRYLLNVCLVVSALSVIFAILNHVELEDTKTKVSVQYALLQTMQTRISQLEQLCSTGGSVTPNSEGDNTAVSPIFDNYVTYLLHKTPIGFYVGRLRGPEAESRAYHARHKLCSNMRM